MPGRVTVISLGALLVMSVGLGALQAQELPLLTHKLTPLEPRPEAPELRLQNMDEEPVDLADRRGRVVVVNFWATWCPPCRREMGSMERLHQATRDLNIDIVAVNIGEDEDTVFSFLGTVEPSPDFEMLFDFDAATLERWKVRGLPTTYVVDVDGRLAYRAVGGREFDHPAIKNILLELAGKSE